MADGMEAGISKTPRYRREAPDPLAASAVVVKLWCPPFGSLLARRGFFPGGWRPRRRFSPPLGSLLARRWDLRHRVFPRRDVSRPRGLGRDFPPRRYGFFFHPRRVLRRGPPSHVTRQSLW